MTEHLYWDEPDNGCVTCGKPHLTIDDHRCADCLNNYVNHCPHCLTDIRALIDREVARRLNTARRDVHHIYTEENYLEWIIKREQVEQARRHYT
jgi:hypothetical protein